MLWNCKLLNERTFLSLRYAQYHFSCCFYRFYSFKQKVFFSIYPFLIFLVWIVQCWLLRSVLLYLQSVWAVSYTHVTTCILIAWNHLDSPFKRQPHIMVKHTQTVRRLLPKNCLSVFNHCMRLALKGLRRRAWIYSYCSVWLQKRYRLPHTKK